MTHHPFNESEVMVAEIRAQERSPYRPSAPSFHKLSPFERRMTVPDLVPLKRDRVIYRVATIDGGSLWLGQRRITQQLSPLYSLYTRHGDEVFRAPLLCLVKAYVRRTF